MIHSAAFWEHVRISVGVSGSLWTPELFWEIISACMPAPSRHTHTHTHTRTHTRSGAAELHLRRVPPSSNIHARTDSHTHSLPDTTVPIPSSVCVLSCSSRRPTSSQD